MSHISLSLSLSPAPPLFVDPSISVTTVEGQEVTLPCATLPDPTLSFTWFFNDVQISLPSNEEGAPVLLANGSLHFSSVEDSREGAYTCEASNSLGSAEGTVLLTVFGKESTLLIDTPLKVHYNIMSNFIVIQFLFKTLCLMGKYIRLFFCLVLVYPLFV